MENGNGHPVTKSELQAILQAALSAQSEDFRAALSTQREELHAALTAQKDELHAALTAQKDELLETIRNVETHLLTEFHRYGQGQQIRLHSLEVSDRDLVLRLAIIEQRLLALESQRPPSV